MKKEEQAKTLEHINSLISSSGMSQKDIADKIGMNTAYLNKILKGKIGLTHDKRDLILSVFNEVSEEDVDLKAYNYDGVQGYIEFNGSITKISNLKDLITLTKKISEEYSTTVSSVKELQKTNDKNSKKLALYDLKVEDIDLYKEETYDASKTFTWSFRKAEDEREEQPNSLGNMCKGYPFTLEGHTFQNSEAAYICGMFSQNTIRHVVAQKALIAEANGYAAKKQIRKKFEITKREDWETFNVQWMLYVVWCKCQTNQAFADMLKAIPRGAMIIENSTLQKGATATFWGMRNQELEDARSQVELFYDLTMYGQKSKDINQKKVLERNKINDIGVWKGVNCMGKILKICQLSLLDGTEPPIDYNLLRSKEIYMIDKLLTFEGK